MKEAVFSERIGRTWLDVDYSGRRISFAYPPVKGTHQENYKAIKADTEIVPAEGLELSLLTYGAFFRDSKPWQDVRDRCISQNYIRIPKRLIWIPSKHKFAGVFIERDLEGRGLSTSMNIPENIDGWKNQNGIYINNNGMIYVPKGKFKLGKHNQSTFPEDGLAIGLLTEEGAEIFAKTAYNNKRTPYIVGVDIDNIISPEQKVAVLYSDRDGLDLIGGGHGDYVNGFSFGVAKNFSIGNQG